MIGSLRQKFMALRPAHRAALVMAVLVVLWLVSGVFGGGNDEDVSADGEATLPAVRTTVLEAEDRSSRLVLFGRTEALRNVMLRAETQGQVAEIVLAKGGAVNSGDVIVRLAVDNRAARLSEAEALVEQNRINYDGAKQLSAQGYKSRLKLAEAKAALESARAHLDAMELDFARTEIRAPFSGVIDDIPVEVGDFVAVGAPVAQVIDLASVVVTAEVSERYAPDVRGGAEARVRLADGREFPGRLRYISRSSEAATRTFKVEVAVDNTAGAIAEGLTAELELQMQSNRAHRVSPAILSLSEAGEVGLKAVDADGIVRFYAVDLVSDTTEGIWVSGLPDRVQVITVGQDFVRAGQQVIAVDAAKIAGASQP